MAQASIMLALYPTIVQTQVRMREIRNELANLVGEHSPLVEAANLNLKQRRADMTPQQLSMYLQYLAMHMLAE